jgi:hypothetical protein
VFESVFRIIGSKKNEVNDQFKILQNLTCNFKGKTRNACIFWCENLLDSRNLEDQGDGKITLGWIWT